MAENKRKEFTAESFWCDDDLSKYTDSLLFSSDTVIASGRFRRGKIVVDVDLMTRGEVRIDFRGVSYRDATEYPAELKKMIEDGIEPFGSNPCGHPDDEAYVEFSNWFEFIYTCGQSSDGALYEGELSDATPDDIKENMLELCECLCPSDVGEDGGFPLPGGREELRALVERGFKLGLVTIIKSPNGDGVVCSIAPLEDSTAFPVDEWFYFGGYTAECYSSPEEYLADTDEATVIDEITDTLCGFFEAGYDFYDEAEYCISVLKDGLKKSDKN